MVTYGKSRIILSSGQDLKMNDPKEVGNSYNKIAKWYDEHRSRDLFEKPWLDKAIALLETNDTVLDVGCGMGEPIAQYFLKAGFKVTGIDGCFELIELAKNRLRKGEFLKADMRTLNLEQQFDLVIAWNSLFHLPQDDQRRMFAIFKNHTKTNGLLLLTTGPEAGEIWSDNGGEKLYHASLSPDEYKQALEQHGFELLDHKINDKDCHEHTVWLARLRDN